MAEVIKRYLVVFDAGHGLKTAGKRTPDGIHEWELNDKARDYAVAYLADYNVDFIFPDGNEGNTDESLYNRLMSYLYSKANAMVSFHHNAWTGKWHTQVTGVEVFTDRDATTQDLRLAECIYGRLVKYTDLKGRGIKSEDWYVINQDKIPAVLVEGGFMDNKNDYEVITSEEGQKAYGRAVAEGIIEFLGLVKVNNTTEKPSSGKKKSLGNVNITYQAYTNKWWPEVKNKTDWAGKGDGTPIRYLAVKVSKGKIRGRVYTEKNGWLPYITFGNSYNLKDLDLGVLGDGSPIEAVELYYYTPEGYAYKKVHYRVSAEDSKEYYSVQTDTDKTKGMDGYAGVKGKFIDKFQAWIE